MTNHLSSQEFVDALGGKDGALAAGRQSHLDGCESCQAQVAELRAVTEDAGHGAEVPEPSPLFWDHFQARLLTAVQSEGQPGRQAWWKSGIETRTLVALGATVVAVVASAALYMSRSVAPAPALVESAQVAESGVPADASTSLDPPVGTGVENYEWEFVASVMGTLEGDDIHEVLAPSHHAVDSAIEALTSDQRDRFMKLLKAEMAEGSE
jgi:hypothetical protein